MCIVSFYFGSVLTLFYYPNSLQWTEIHHVAKFDAVPLLSKKIVPPISAVYGNCTSSFGVVMSQFVREFRDEVSLLQRFNQEQQMIFLLITAGSTKRKERKHTGAHVVWSNLSSAWASCDLLGLQALICSLIKLVALLGTSMGGRRPPCVDTPFCNH